MKLRLRDSFLEPNGPLVMGVLNVTPDSFSDGGRFVSMEAALDRARLMFGEGAAIIDVGGESTRPGAEPVGEQEELDRVLPVIERILQELPCAVSIDSMKPAVMDAVCGVGAAIINDVNALRAPGALEVAVRHKAAVCLMHMQGEPRTMQQAPHYEDVVEEVLEFLLDRARSCVQAGLPADAILLDPGFGFGKTLDHNLRLLSELPRIVAMGYPVLVGMSRKGMLGAVLSADLDQRLAAGVAAAVVAAIKGAAIVRTHDVRATCDALKLVQAVQNVGNK